MPIHITTIKKNNTIYLPNRFLDHLELGVGDSVVIVLSEDGIKIRKSTVFNQIDGFFESMDEELKQEFLSRKTKKYFKVSNPVRKDS